MNRYEKQKVAVEKAIGEQIEEYKAIYKNAENEDRDPTDDERLDIESHLKAIETLKKEREEAEANIRTLQHVDDLGKSLGPAVSVISEPHDRMFDQIQRALPIPKDMGSQFIESAGYKSIINQYHEQGRFPTGFSTGPIGLDTKGTLMEGVTGSGSGLMPVPQVIPGIVDQQFQRLTFADLVLSGQTSTNSIRYVIEGTATSGAAGVGEGTAKPESTLGFGVQDEAVKKIATLLPVSEETLQDAPAIQSYINGRLTLFIQIEEERQLLRGAAASTEVQGLLSRSVPVYTGATATDGNAAEQLFRALNSMRGSALMEPEWVVLHPDDYETIRLLKDTNGQLYGGGPFFGPYGNGGQANASGQITGATETVWGKPLLVTSAVGTGTAVIGTRSSSQVFRRGGLSVEATNSHSTYFALNLVAIRAETRLAYAVYRNSGYVELRFGA